MRVLVAVPARRNFRKQFPQDRDVVGGEARNSAWNFDGAENPPTLARLAHFAGSKTIVSFVAFAIAASVKGNSRGVTARQSGSCSFQCGFVGRPDSPSV